MADRQQHHGLPRSRKGSKYNVQWFYLVRSDFRQLFFKTVVLTVGVRNYTLNKW